MTPPVPQGYDPFTLNHWTLWLVRCMSATPTEFQRLFEEVAARLQGGFMRIKPCGRIGDRKCDGLYFGNGTAFQVYSPDRLTQAKTLAKIEEDLAGAVSH